ncbi:MAG: KH domain-containing protein [Acidimicrobiia bacterium]
MTKPEIAERVLRYVVENIVDEPTAIQIEMIEEGDAAATAEVKTAKGDMGRVIGRRGRTARSIRTVTSAAGEEEGFDVRVEFLD